MQVLGLIDMGLACSGVLLRMGLVEGLHSKIALIRRGLRGFRERNSSRWTTIQHGPPSIHHWRWPALGDSMHLRCVLLIQLDIFVLYSYTTFLA